ncbi:MAG: hypothetical protein RL737_1302 [Bacteroidota bacterium]|jgi:hypothetical protein
MKILLIFIAILPLTVNAQSFVNRTYSQQYDIQAKSVVQMGNGNYLVVGTQAFANGFLTVHTPQGQAFQATFLSQGALSSFSEFNQITKINDTLAVIGGKISLAVGASEIWQGISMAVNQQGQALWTLTHSISDPGMDATVRDIERINDTSFFVLTSGISGVSNSLSKITASGNVLWTTSYDSNLNGFQLNDICLADSSLFVCGSIFNLGNFSGIIMKIDAVGNIIEGSKYDHTVQPDFIQVIPQHGAIILANRGHAMESVDVMKMDFNGNVVAQKTFQGGLSMPEDLATKPLSVIDSANCWYWRGSGFGSYAHRIESMNLLPTQTLMHYGNIQTLMEGDTSITILSTGPLYGIKSQVILQKHYAISEVDSIEALYAYCTYPQNELPLNEIAPIKTTFTPTVTNGPSPSPLFYPLNSNEPWVNEPFCVEMLGEVREYELRFGPNPCDDFIQIEGYGSVNYSIYSTEGKLVVQGMTDEHGIIPTLKLNNGIYILKLLEKSITIQIQH